MQPPALPPNELARLASLRGMSLLDTPAEERFDRLTRIAKNLFEVPTALISLVDAERQWFKSKQGLAACSTSREVSFCGHAILEEEVLWIDDATKDPRFQDNPLVTGPLGIRFYAGVPLTNAEGHRIGTLCLIDQEPRQRSESDLNLLQDLGQLVQLELEHDQGEENALRFAAEDHAERSQHLDPVTGCWNATGIREVVSRGLDTCARTHQSAAVLLVRGVGPEGRDADLNSETADEVAQTLRRSARNYDPVGRLDGSRFLVFLVGFDKSRLRDLEEVIRSCMAQSSVFEGGALQLEIGQAVFNPNFHRPDASWLFELAADNLSENRRLSLGAA